MTKKKPLILITVKYSDEAFYKLKNSNLVDVEKIFSTEQLHELLPKATGLIIRSQTHINQQILNRASSLQFIITCTSGFDHINLELTQKHQIKVMYTPDANAQSAAELTWGLVLDTNRHISSADRSLRQSSLSQTGWIRNQFEGRELSGLTYGVIGLGRIGQKVAQFAKAFGLEVIVYDPYQEDHIFTSLALDRSSYEEVLKQSDIISFHVPLTPETKNMLNRSHFEYTNKDLVVINTSRGSIINEEDLIMALENNLISAAGLDVYQKEPLSYNSKLLQIKNVVLTQHMGALTQKAFQKASDEACELCLDYIKNLKTRNTLPLKNNWGSLTFND